MSNMSELDRSAPLLSKSTNFVSLFAKQLPSQYLQLCAMKLKKTYLQIKSHLASDFNKNELKLINYKIEYKQHKIYSISKRYKYRKYLIKPTRNLPSVQITREKVGKIAGQKYKEILEQQMKKDLDVPLEQTSRTSREESQSFTLNLNKLKNPTSGLCFCMTMALAKKKLKESLSWVEAQCHQIKKQYSLG